MRRPCPAMGACDGFLAVPHQLRGAGGIDRGRGIGHDLDHADAPKLKTGAKAGLIRGSQFEPARRPEQFLAIGCKPLLPRQCVGAEDDSIHDARSIGLRRNGNGRSSIPTVVAVPRIRQLCLNFSRFHNSPIAFHSAPRRHPFVLAINAGLRICRIGRRRCLRRSERLIVAECF
jgi:hypothetical protein